MMDSQSQETDLVSKTLPKKYHGIVVPMLTPATEDGRIDEVSATHLIGNLVDAGTDPFLFGTTGEASSISTSEKVRLASLLCPQFVDRTTVYMGISSNCLEDSIELAQRFADLGSHVAVANLPSYLALVPDQMLKYFEQLADGIPLPLILYNIPITTHMSIPLEVVESLSHHPNIVGLKDSERDLERLKSATAQYKDREDFCHLTGWAPQAVNALQWGSDGVVPVTANLVPQLYQKLYNAVTQGESGIADRCQIESNEISKIFQENRTLGESLAAIKVLLNVSGICSTAMFPPLTTVTDSEQEQLKNQWAAFKRQ
ncbi:MAG: hypothetical protein CBC93_05965 [Gammaproteobacteria bacterium TMED133]|nr:MAG: hypothetical protein CBC93_05965 [Gammaproteobacteria bacterium TMED133]